MEKMFPDVMKILNRIWSADISLLESEKCQGNCFIFVSSQKGLKFFFSIVFMKIKHISECNLQDNLLLRKHLILLLCQ